MKKLLIIFLTSFLFAAKIYTNLDNASDTAISQNKPIALFIMSSTCPHCRKLVNEMVKNNRFMRFLVDNYVFCVIDVSRQYPSKEIPFNGYVPYIAVLTPDKKIMATPIRGEPSLRGLYMYLYEALKLYSTLKAQGYGENYYYQQR